MGVSLGGMRSMIAVMGMMPEVEVIVNYQPLVDYVLALHNSGLDTINDPCVTPDSRELLPADGGTCDPYRNTGCTYYGSTWGPIDPTDMTSDCIKVSSGFNEIGRFKSIHGNPASFVYGSGQVEANWDTIITEAGW